MLNDDLLIRKKSLPKWFVDNIEEWVTKWKNWMPLNCVADLYLHRRPKKLHSFRRRFLTIMDMIKSERNNSVLDVGCSAGIFSVQLAKKSKHVYGLDTYPRIFLLARLLARSENVEEKTSFLVGRCEALQFRYDSFDLILCGEIIEHLSNPELSMTEVRRVLKPGTTLVISTPNEGNLFRAFLHKFLPLTPGHIHEFNIYELRKLVETSKMRVVSTIFINPVLEPISSWVIQRIPNTWFDRIYVPLCSLIEKTPLIRSILCETIVIKCKKHIRQKKLQRKQ